MFNDYLFFEKMYFHELERKQHLENNTSLPTGAIVASFGLLGYFFTHFSFGGRPYWQSWVIEVVFLTSALASFLRLCFATYWCVQAVIGSAYEYLPGTKTMHDYLHKLENWHRSQKTRNPKLEAERDFQVFLLEALASCSQKNWQTNLVRSEELFRTKQFTVYALISLAVLAICYYIDFWFDAPKLISAS